MFRQGSPTNHLLTEVCVANNTSFPSSQKVEKGALWRRDRWRGIKWESLAVSSDRQSSATRL